MQVLKVEYEKNSENRYPIGIGGSPDVWLEMPIGLLNTQHALMAWSLPTGSSITNGNAGNKNLFASRPGRPRKSLPEL